MTTQTQTAANRANAQHSTGPKTNDGIVHASMNNFRHGLAGAFMIAAWESQHEFDQLYDALRAEHAPSTPIEVLLVERIAQHFWLTQRAIRFQNNCLENACQQRTMTGGSLSISAIKPPTTAPSTNPSTLC